MKRLSSLRAPVVKKAVQDKLNIPILALQDDFYGKRGHG